MFYRGFHYPNYVQSLLKRIRTWTFLSMGEKLCPSELGLFLHTHIDSKMIALINSNEDLLALTVMKNSDSRL